MKQASSRVVIGIDPGLASTGYGVVAFSRSRLAYVDHGVIKTTADMPHQERLLVIYHGVAALLERFSPTEAGMETLYFAKNVSSAMAVAEARGVVTLALALKGIPLGEYTPHGIKQAVVGVARADKSQVQEAVRVLLGLTDIPRPDHAADALAAAITRVHTVDIRSLVL